MEKKQVYSFMNDVGLPQPDAADLRGRQSVRATFKLSVRAIPGCDATRVTVPFGGGGHKGAAGATLPSPLEEAAKAVEEVMLAL